MVEECLRIARRAGYARMVLSTFSAMVEARRIYTRAGFTIVNSAPVTAFGAELTDEEWSLDLTAVEA
ncbi:hypothetical protein ACQPWW_13135 [Micromonospora sp. CA-240977]|uniref:hypothetical protein n=1 Tax=Micromonospora sp. CA-240977 TaxID=3239957 RepID=UPI003D8F7B58